MAGLFFMFIVIVMFGEMLDGYLKAQDESDDSGTPAAIVFTPDDDVSEWEDVLGSELSSELFGNKEIKHYLCN